VSFLWKTRWIEPAEPGDSVGRGARRPVSRVLSAPGVSRRRARDGHSSGTRLAARLARPTRATGRECPCDNLADRSARPRRSPLFGLAPGGVYPAAPVTRGAVRSCRTVSPLPAGDEPLRRRTVLCGTFPGVAPAGR